MVQLNTGKIFGATIKFLLKTLIKFIQDLHSTLLTCQVETSLTNRIIIIVAVFSLGGCSLLNQENSQEEKKLLAGYEKNQKNDYLNHFSEFKNFYLASSSTKSVRLDRRNQRYLNSVVDAIISSNELFFKSKSKPSFYVIKSETPFHFSLPNKQIFISSGLISKYIKNESLLYCLVTYELIRSEAGLYKKKMIIPTGTIDTYRMMSIVRLKTQEKVEIHKWAFYILKRVGIDTDIYLSWIQIQNRNSIDFSLLLGDVNSISREESLFKSFIIKNTKEEARADNYKGSSRDFYYFVNKIR